jgi:hypothetical protein
MNDDFDAFGETWDINEDPIEEDMFNTWCPLPKKICRLSDPKNRYLVRPWTGKDNSQDFDAWYVAWDQFTQTLFIHESPFHRSPPIMVDAIHIPPLGHGRMK